ncbi:MAG: PQQ-binding-like beta-propeller repeat protein, partial [Acidimicrobiia bacterium]
MGRRARRDVLSYFNEADRSRGRSIFFNVSPRWRRFRLWLPVAATLLLLGGAGFFIVTRGSSSPEAAPAAPAETPSATPVTAPSVNAAGVLTCPDAVEVGWSTFQGSPARTGCVEARTIANPKILWRADVGIQGWLNNPVIGGSRVFVGSAGQLQLTSDDGDGIYAVDLLRGEILWFIPASADVNGVGYAEGVVVATGDEGKVWALRALNGAELWSHSLDNPIFGNPLTVNGLVVVGDAGGNLYAYDLHTGALEWQNHLEGAVRGGAASDGEVIYAVGEQREVGAFAMDGTPIWRKRITGTGEKAEGIRIFAAPTVAEDVVAIPYIRDDTYPEPALLALDRSTGAIRWRASGPDIKTNWANLRSSPAVLGDLLVFGEAYSNKLVAVGVDDGTAQWAADVGVHCFPHWPSPAIVGGQVLLPRHDGGLYAVDAATGRTAWSIYLGEVGLLGEFPLDFDNEFCGWQPRTGWP